MINDDLRLAYVGCRTTAERSASGLGLTTWATFGETTAEPWALLDTAPAVNPSYLYLDAGPVNPDRAVLWAVHGDFGEVTAYRLDDPARPSVVSTLSTGGRNPVHLGLSRPDTLLVANYATGTIGIIDVDADGLPVGLHGVLELPGQRGPHPTQQTSSHPHQVRLEAGSSIAWVPDKGLDRVFALDVSSARPTVVGVRDCPPGSGPRHAVRHPQLPLLYVAEELSSRLAVHDIDGATLHPVARFSTRTGEQASLDPDAPAEFTDNTAAGLAISLDGTGLFVSNRGDDSITCFALDPHGAPTPTAVVASGVRCPRFITITPAGGLLVAGETSHELVVHAVEPGGQLAASSVVASTGSPTCVAFAPSPPTAERTSRP